LFSKNQQLDRNNRNTHKLTGLTISSKLKKNERKENLHHLNIKHSTEKNLHNSLRNVQ